MKPSFLFTLTAVFLVLPRAGWACGACVDSWLRFGLPTYHWLLLAMLLWGMAHAFCGERWSPGSGRNLWPVVWRCILFLLASLVAALMTAGSTVLIAVFLAGIYLGAIWRLFFRNGSRGGRVVALVAAVVFSFLVGLGVAQRLGRDSFDNVRMTVFGGTTTMRHFSNLYARDPDFDLNRLRPMITGGERNDREFAFMILGTRKNAADLDLLEEEIKSLPRAFFEKSNWSEPGAMYFHMWLQNINADLEQLAERLGKVPT